MLHHLLVVFALTLAPALVHADVPPPPDYVESCTVARQSAGGGECRECRTYHGNPANYCADPVDAGFTRACRSYGASVWTEVWCRGTPDGSIADASTSTMPDARPDDSAKPAESDGCSALGAAPSLTSPLLMVALALLLSSRRRRT